MLIIINDHKKASGKTTLAKEILKDKDFLELPNMRPFTDRFCSFEEIPKWILIDGASEIDIEVAEKLADIEFLIFDNKYSSGKTMLQVPSFILITNQKLEIKLIEKQSKKE